MEKKQVKTNFIKKNWYIIVICILVAFGMSQCTKSCTRGQNIKSQNKEIVKRDSVIDAINLKVDTLTNSLHYYTALYESEIQHNSNFASIATGNQNELYNQMNQLNNQILGLQNEKIMLEKNLKNLTKENSILRDSINHYKNLSNMK